MEKKSEFRSKMVQALGLPWETCDRGIQMEAQEETDEGYTRILISYNVERTERVRAFLLVPKAIKGKAPAVVACHQHNVTFQIGKSEPAGLAGLPDMAYGADLCRRGYVVICPDMLCFEDRRPQKWREEKYDHDCTYEKLTYLKYLAAGSSLTAKYLHDYTCAVDVLYALPYVDRTRIFSFGHSTGGQCALWLAWYDERIFGGVSSCGFARIQDLRAANKEHNLAMVAPGMLSIGDYENLVEDLAPKPFAFTCGTYDPTFLLDSVRKIGKAAKQAYVEKGAEAYLYQEYFEGWHWIRKETRERLYHWMESVGK